MFRRGMKEDTSDRTVSGGLGYDKPWYSASCNLGPPKGRAFQGNGSLPDNAVYSRCGSLAGSPCNETGRGSAANGTTPTMNRKSGRPISPGDRQKHVVSGNGRSRMQQELDFSGGRFSPSGATVDRGMSPRGTPRSSEKSLRSILKHETNARPRPSQESLYRPHTPSRPQSSQGPFPATTLPPPPFRQSRIPRCTFFNSNGDFCQTKSDRSQSSNACCYDRRPTSSMENHSPRRREAAGSKKKSNSKFQTDKERSAIREWECATDGQFGGGTCDWGVAGSRSAASAGRRTETTSDQNSDRKSTRRVQSENDVRRSPRRSPRGMDDGCCSDEFLQSSGSWSNRVDIVTNIPYTHQQQLLAHDRTPPSISSDTSGSARPYYLRVFENVFDWLSSFADTQWANLKMFKQAAEKYVVPHVRAKRTASYPDRLCSKSCPSTSCSKSQTDPSASSNSRAFSSTCYRSRTSSCEQEPYASLEEKWGTLRKQKNPGDPKLSNSRSELKSSTEGQSCYSRTSSSAMEIAGSRLDRMQENAADAITHMRGPEFVLPKKLLKSETLLTSSLTKEFEEISSTPSSCRRTAQLRKLLSELPAENYYVVEWLVTNNIINESNASRLGRLIKVKPHVLEVLTRDRSLLFPDAL